MLEEFAMGVKKADSSADPSVQEWPAVTIGAEAVNLQLTISTDDPRACVVQLRGFAQATDIELSKMAPELLPPEADDVTVAAEAIERSAIKGEPEPPGLVLRMLSDRLYPLVMKLNAKERQSARVARIRSAHRAPQNDPGEGIWRAEMDVMLAQERTRINQKDRPADDEFLRLDWRALLDEQLPVSPIVPVFDPGTPLVLKVLVYRNREPASVERQSESE